MCAAGGNRQNLVCDVAAQNCARLWHARVVGRNHPRTSTTSAVSDCGTLMDAIVGVGEAVNA
jgi:hypothetical protein